MRSPLKPVLCELGVMLLQSKFTSLISWVCIVDVIISISFRLCIVYSVYHACIFFIFFIFILYFV